eukprot:TRINITY_DN8747_c0_g5_i1.p1 TRINITY_DN8747_c0_g5~~TRINITY_DN8747_c0_g5_i1.p1  ORF type:complete len:215 (-),score=55.83 TRINITY_DN8747_c0_g5_i1:512-1156(-)
MLIEGNEKENEDDDFKTIGTEGSHIESPTTSRETRSFRRLLMKAFPEHNWLIWKFSPIPTGFWNNPDNVVKYLNWLEGELGIKEKEDWYRISYDEISKLHGSKLLKKYGGIPKILKAFYPHVKWDLKKFSPTTFGKKTQKRLKDSLQEVFTELEIIEEYRFQEFFFPGSGRPVEVDIYIPKIKLAFEYQGEHHYNHSQLFGNSNQFQERWEWIG